MRLSRSNNRSLGCVAAAIFAAIIICFLIVAGISLWPALREDGQFRFSYDLIVPIFMLIIFGAVGLGLGIFALRPFVTRLQIADPQLTVSKEHLRVGETFTLHYRQEFKRSADVQQIAIALILREVARYQVGTDTRTVTHDHVVEQQRYGARRYDAGQAFELELDLQIPTDSMHTFSATNNKLIWNIVVRVEASGWPDLAETYELQVLPERVGG